MDRLAGVRAHADEVRDLWERDGARLIRVTARGGVETVQGLPLWRRTAGCEFDAAMLLGLGDTPVFVQVVDADWPDVRTLRLESTERQLLHAAVALGAWNGSEPRCERCGAGTGTTHAGWQRRCRHCGQVCFPRVDPCVIVAVCHQDRLLLAHDSRFREGRHSLLAGFVEPGESLEAAAHREVAEETGVRLSSLRYVGSQPHPFPRSLMCAFVATADSAEVHPDGEEIVSAAYFSRDEVTQQLRLGTMTVPTGWSASGQLIDAWRQGADLTDAASAPTVR